MLWADPFRFAVPEPRRGGLIVAQGKAAEAAALGKKPPHPTSFVSSGLARLWHAKPEEKKEVILLGPQPRAALRLPGAIIISSLRDFSLARCARIVGERRVQPRRATGNRKIPRRGPGVGWQDWLATRQIMALDESGFPLPDRRGR